MYYNTQVRVGLRPNKEFSTSFQDAKKSQHSLSLISGEAKAVTPRETFEVPQIYRCKSEMSGDSSTSNQQKKLPISLQSRSSKLAAKLNLQKASSDESDNSKPSAINQGKIVNVRFKNNLSKEPKNMKIEMKESMLIHRFLLYLIFFMYEY